MGQQQLILLVLATVIVGVAIVVGIRAFTENSAKSNYDAMVQDAVRIANDAQAWKKKPAPFGGQGALATDEDNYTGATYTLLGYNAESGTLYSNLNGCYQLAPTATGLTITGTNAQEGNRIAILVDGLTDVDIDQVAAQSVIGDRTTISSVPCGATTP